MDTIEKIREAELASDSAEKEAVVEADRIVAEAEDAASSLKVNLTKEAKAKADALLQEAKAKSDSILADAASSAEAEAKAAEIKAKAQAKIQEAAAKDFLEKVDIRKKVTEKQRHIREFQESFHQRVSAIHAEAAQEISAFNGKCDINPILFVNIVLKF